MGFRIAVLATLGVQPFVACTNSDVDFTIVSRAGSEPATHAGSGGNGAGGKGAGVAGGAHAGVGATIGDAGSSGSLGDAGESGAAGSDGTAGSADGGTRNEGGRGGQAGGGAGRGGSGGNGMGGGAGRGGASGASGAGGDGGAGRGGASGGNGTGGAGRGGASGAGAGGGAGHAGGSGTAGGAGAAPVCGNQVLEKGEQCDDGNTKSTDACSASCDFEQSQRANLIEQRFRTTSFCPKNAFGVAFAGTGQSTLQAIVDRRVKSGALSLLFAFRGLHDLSGMSAEQFTLGVAYGSPSVAADYDGSSDLDWWYTPATGQIDDSGVLYSSSSAVLSDGVLDAQPDSLRIPLLSEVPIYVSNVKLRLSIGDSSAPLSSSGVAPGHLASEHLRPSLVSFASAGPPASTDPGQLCGSLSAASLSSVAIPATYASNGASPCAEGYAATRTFLDLLVGGCTVAGDELVAPTQPDQSDPGAPAAGAGGPYRLIANNNNAVSGCRDKNNGSVMLSACLNAAAYSSAYRLRTGRAIIKR